MGNSIIFLTHEEQDFITKMETHKVLWVLFFRKKSKWIEDWISYFSLQEYEAEDSLKELCVLMEEDDQQSAALALQSHYERAIANDKDLHKLGCLGKAG